jgi:hypothetical protein
MTEHLVTRKEALMAAGGLGAALALGRWPGSAYAADTPCYGWPAIAGDPPVLPYPTIYQETQGWWVQGRTSLSAPAADFPFTSAHVHAGVAYPTGETVTRVNNLWEWPFFCQLHNFQGGHGKNFRGGGFLDGSLQNVPAPPNMVNPQAATETWRGVLRTNSSPSNGKHENRFTFDTTGPFGKRMYQSGAWWTFVGVSPTPVPGLARGWYDGPGYTNAGVATGYRASAPLRAGQTVSYILREGAKWAFAYADADIHGGSKGTVIFENRMGDGSFQIPAGARVLLLGGWEKASGGWNAGVLRLPLA